jgi:hypothetical protein
MLGAMWKTVAGDLGKHQARRRATKVTRQVPWRSQNSKVSAGWTNKPAEDTEFLVGIAHLFPVLLTWFRPFDCSHSLQRMVPYTPYTFLTSEQNLI